jgi:iron complex outermembrane receptor protein
MNQKRLVFSVAASCAMLGMSPFAVVSTAFAAATSTTSAVELEEVIVTANKREESAQKVAQTVNVVSGQALEELQIRSFQEVATAVAGLSLSRVSGGEQSASMRGIKMSNPGGAASATNTVEMYENEVPITAVDSFNSLFDVGQIEVLRGPQGTLRGRPSPSGAITIAPRRGSYTGSDGFVEAGFSDHAGRNAQAAWGGPIANNLALRVAGFYDANNDNQIKSLGNGKHSYHKTSAGRATLSWKPMESLEFNLMEQYIHQDQDFYRGIAGTDTFPASIGFGRTFTYADKIALNKGDNPNSYRASLTTLTARYDIGDYSLNYVGGYNASEFKYVLDFDFAGVGGQPYIYLGSHPKTLSNELRFESTAGKVYNFTYGAFTSKANYNSFFVFSFARPYVDGTNAPYSFRDTGLFTNQRFNLGSKDKLSLGLRSSAYKVDRPAAGPGSGPDVNYNATTGNASYQHEFTDTVMAYASYGRSFRPGSGGANNTGTNPIPARFANFNEEKSTSWEIGLKSQWFDRRLTTNIAYYDQKYNGFIGVTNNVACTGVPNPNGLAFASVDGTAAGNICRQNVSFNGNAVSKGLELELNAKLTQDWSLGVNYSYSDAHFNNALIPCNDYNGDGNPDNAGVPLVQRGQYVSLCATSAPLGQLAPHSYSALTNYDFRVGELGAYIRANMIHNDQSYFPQTGQFLSADTRVNAYVGLKGRDHKWEVSLWAKNVFDKVVQDNDGGGWSVGGVPTGLNVGTSTYGRELGATLRWDF